MRKNARIYQLAKKGIFDEKTIKVDSKIIAIKTQFNDGLIDEYELGTMIEAGVQFMRNPVGTWNKVRLDNKQRIQKMIFPKVLIYDPIKWIWKYGFVASLRGITGCLC